MVRKKLVTSTDEFRNLKEPWQQLLEKIPNHTIFMTWEWQFIWWETYAARFPESQLRILAYFKEEELVAILPYFVYTEAFGPVRLRKAAYLGSKIESSDYLDVITLPEYEPYFMQHLEDDLRELAAGADIIELNNCLPDSLFYRVLGGQKNGHAFTETYRVCPYVELPETFDAYLKQLSSNFRYNVRRRVKKLLNKTGARFEEVNTTENIDAVIEDIFKLHYQRALQKGLDTKFVRELRETFHKEVARALLPKHYIRIFHLLSAENEKIAALYCFEYDKTLAYFQAGFNPDWSNFSPGMVILAKAIEYAIEHNMRMFDFMRGGEAYKKNWGTVDRFIYLITVPNSGKGNKYYQYYKIRKRLAPVVKKWLAHVKG